MDSETTQQLIDAQNLTTNAMHRHHTEQQTQRDIAEIKSMLKAIVGKLDIQLGKDSGLYLATEHKQAKVK